MNSSKLIFIGLVVFVAIASGRRDGRRQAVRCGDGSRPTKGCSDGSEKARRQPCPEGATVVNTCADGSTPTPIIKPGRCADNTRPSCADGSRVQKLCADGSVKRRRPCADGSEAAKKCTNGESPVCSDGSTPTPSQRNRRNNN